MDTIKNAAVYMSQDTRITQYLPYPQYLLTLDISGTAKVLYALLLNRATLSQRNAWLDDKGYVYIVYTIDAMTEDLRKSRTTVKHALSELDQCGLLERRPAGFGRPNHLYVKLIEGQISDMRQERKLPRGWQESGPRIGRKSASGGDGLPASNNYKNNKIQNNLSGVMEQCTAYGRYQNILLLDTEYSDLQKEFPDDLERFIGEMSNYLAATVKTYTNYAAALRMWAANDKKTPIKKPELEDYSCEEGESY